MAWDSSRPVPWQRLLKEWSIYATLMGVAFALLFRDRALGGVVLGLLASGPLYLLLGAVLAKFGYQRKTMREARAAAIAARAGSGAEAGGEGAPRRPKPPPTKRTGGGRPQRR